ncbi:MAG: M43 family zinc metalloprotease [Saprospiraceae bacterium]
MASEDSPAFSFNFEFSMHIRLFIISSLICISRLSTGQTGWCNAYDQFITKDDTLNYDAFLQKVREQELHPLIRNRAEIWYQVVVHIVLPEVSIVISNTQVIEQIDVLNNDFAGKGNNISKLQKEFEPLVTDTGIRFCLATTDPAGKPTDGITYTFTTLPNIGEQHSGQGGRRNVHFDALGGKNGWDPTRYINIWVCEYGDFLGSAFFPGMAPYPEEIGVVIDHRSFGSLGEASAHSFYSGGHTLTHEMGHFFGLIHIWGNDEHSCTDSDEVEDTPNQDGPYFDCPSGTQMSCGVNNMYQDFMDLTDDRCLAAFTHGQAERMQASIDAFYPNLGTGNPCHDEVQPFNKWYDELIWAFDRNSEQYVIYHPSAFSGNSTIEVFSADGRLVLKDYWNDSQTYLLKLNLYARGIYFVRISNGKNEKIRKVVTY